MKDSTRLGITPVLKGLLLLVAIFNGLFGLFALIISFSPDYIYKKDFAQEYLMAKAILNGVNPYLPVQELAQTWLSGTDYKAISHPSLHPPLVGLLCLPLGLLSYWEAALVWLVFQLVCLWAAFLLICRWSGRQIKPVTLLMPLVAVLVCGPFVDELWFGQLNACMLLLLVGSWLTLRTGKEALGGALLGGVIALKWMAWPLVIFLLLRRKWKSAIMSAAVVSAANLLAMSVLGFEIMKDYYFKIVPSASYIRTFEFNISASALGLHLFTELGWHNKLLPLWNSPMLASISGLLITLTVLLIGLRMALKASKFDTAFGLLVGISILVSPVAWSHYLILATIPFAILVNRLRPLGFRHTLSIRTFYLSIPLMFTAGTYGVLVKSLASQETPDGLPIVPFLPGLVLMLPTVSLIGILWLVWQFDKTEWPRHHRVALESEVESLSATMGVPLEGAVRDYKL
jgi:hypothetical protein